MSRFSLQKSEFPPKLGWFSGPMWMLVDHLPGLWDTIQRTVSLLTQSCYTGPPVRDGVLGWGWSQWPWICDCEACETLVNQWPFGVSRNGGTPSYHPILVAIFHEINHPATELSPFVETPTFWGLTVAYPPILVRTFQASRSRSPMNPGCSHECHTSLVRVRESRETWFFFYQV